MKQPTPVDQKLGLLLAVSVCAANLQDRDVGTDTVTSAVEKYPTVQRLYVDSAMPDNGWPATEAQHGLTVEVVRHPANRNVGRWVKVGQQDLFLETLATGFTVLPKRWVVERTHAWNERVRRMSHAPRSLDQGIRSLGLAYGSQNAGLPVNWAIYFVYTL